jgi:DNA-3-methyladenine glycosylase
MKILSKKFYSRNPKIIAKELLGKILVRSLNKKILSGRIVETEAYYGKKIQLQEPIPKGQNFALN